MAYAMDPPHRVREGRGGEGLGVMRRLSERIPFSEQTPANHSTNQNGIHETSPMFSPTQERRSFETSNQERCSFDRASSSSNDFAHPSPSATERTAAAAPITLLFRRLSSNMDDQGLKNLLAFAEGVFDAHFISLLYPEDRGFYTATASFRNLQSAQDVQRRLNGKTNCTNSATMIVDYLTSANRQTISPTRWTTGTQLSRQISTSNSSGSSSHAILTRRTSNHATYLNSHMHENHDQVLPTLPGQFQREPREPNAGLQRNGRLSSQTSPEATFRDQPNISTRSAVNDTIDDDETRDILNDPVRYARGGSQRGQDHRFGARPTVLTDFSNLSLNSGQSFQTNGSVNELHPRSPSGPAHSSRLDHTIYSSSYEVPQNLWSPQTFHRVTSNSSRQYGNESSPRYQDPPANPADSHPPCNTLYVGNLPQNTSEDELKTIFMRARGYRKLLLRHKSNGIVCFCEFEDIPAATKALHELYGTLLHNSTKGGIRLSFSKNQLGVRSGQGSSMSLQSPLSPGAYPSNGGAMGAPPGFSAATGPPPGLPAAPMSQGMNSVNGMGPNYFTSTSNQTARFYNGQPGLRNVSGPAGFTPSGGHFENGGTQAPRRTFSVNGNMNDYQPTTNSSGFAFPRDLNGLTS